MEQELGRLWGSKGDVYLPLFRKDMTSDNRNRHPGYFTGSRVMLLGSKVEAVYLEQETFIVRRRLQKVPCVNCRKKWLFTVVR